jgi:error-prone DNA polymerase
MSLGEQVIADYRTTGLSVRAHPCALLRPRLAAAGLLTCAAAAAARDGARVLLGGIVTVRQKPGTAKGTVFITIEDETGIANLIVWPALVEVFRNQILGSVLLIVEGQVQRGEEGVVHIVARRLADRSRWLAGLDAPPAHGDELPRPRPPGHPRHERILRRSRDFH